MRSGWLLSLLALTACGGLFSGAMTQTGLVPEHRTMEAGARAHGWQTASFIYAFADGSSLVWLKTLDAMERDALPLLAELKASGTTMSLALEDFDADGRAAVTAYELSMRVGEHTLPGKPGTDPDAYEAALAPAAETSGIPAPLLKKGHFALYGLANGMTPSNAAHDSLKQHAFKLLVLRAKIAAGQTQVDYFDPNRPAEESLADIDEALAMIEAEHRRLTAQRAAILAMVAMAQRYREPKALELLAEQLEESRAATEQWRASHRRPTADDHGVRAAKLPSVLDVQKRLKEKLGFLGALADVAQAVVSANPQKAVEALAALAPEDTTIAVALDGLAAATRGDVMGTVEAVAALAGEGETVQSIKRRVEQIEGAVGTVKGL